MGSEKCAHTFYPQGVSYWVVSIILETPNIYILNSKGKSKKKKKIVKIPIQILENFSSEKILEEFNWWIFSFKIKVYSLKS